MVVLTGGDPLKRWDIYDLIDYATRSGLKVSMTPSATPLVTKNALARLRDAGVSRLALSLDGADPRIHDRFRGVPGSFVRTLEIMSDARALGMPVQINTTVTPANCHQLEALAGALEQNMIEQSDEAHLDIASAQGRVLYSFNIGDYHHLHTVYLKEGKSHAGIILAPQQRYTVGQQMRRLLKLTATFSAREMQNRLEFLSNW